MRVLPLAIVALTLTLMKSGATDRVALLIANHEYGDEQLPAVRASLDHLSPALRELGFRVTTLENLDSKAIETAFRSFADSTPTNGIALIYFAGFGGQIELKEAENTTRWVSGIHSIDAVKDTGTIQRQSIPIPKFREWTEKTSGARTTFLFLDCAENRFHNTEVRPGLTEISENDLLDGTVVALAAPPGENITFSANGPTAFARALANVLESGDLGQLPWQRAFPKIAGEKITLPEKPTRKFLDSEVPRPGEFPGQEWISPFGAVFCWCPPGKFIMGDPSFDDAEPVAAEMTKGYWIGKYEYSQREHWLTSNRGPKADVILSHRLAPVVQMKYGDATGTVKKLNGIEQKAGRLPDGWSYALPTEAEWEYACRAGSKTAYAFGDSPDELDRHGNFADGRLLAADDTFHWASQTQDDGTGVGPARVGSYLPNAWGIHDMHGNVAEWTADLYLPELTGGKNPRPSDQIKDAPGKVFRGGAWCSQASYCRSGFRNFGSASNNGQSDQFTGIRIVLRQDPQP